MFDERTTNLIAAALAAPPPSASFMTIGDLAGLEGISRTAIRFYESHGLLSPRRLGRLRIYSPNDRGRLRSIVEFRRMGLPVSRIGQAMRAGCGVPYNRRRRAIAGILNSHLLALESRLKRLDGKIEETMAALERARNPMSATASIG